MSLSLVLLMIFSALAPFLQGNTSLELEDKPHRLDAAKSSSLIDVPSLRIGDEWVYDAYFDVAGLIAAGGVSANIQTLTGTLTSEVDSISTQTVENRSSLVYTIESTGSFGANGVSLDGYSGNLDVDYEGIEVYRVSDMALISRSMGLEVNFLAFGFINIDVADITILTTYQPPQEGFDFPISVGEAHYSNYTSTVQWSGSSDYFDIPEDETSQTSAGYAVISTGDPGVPYSGCASSYNVTQYNSAGDVTGFNWYCPAVKYNAWQHIEDAIGLVIDFKLKAHTPAPRTRLISVDLQYPAYFLDYEIGAWLNVTDAGGTPVSGESIEFRYEAESDLRVVTTASNGSAFVIFDTGHSLDPSYTSFDYASHGIIGWISGSSQVGVSTLTLDDDLVEVDLLTSADGVTVERARGADVVTLNLGTGFNAVPGDQLTFSVPVRNMGLLNSPTTQLEITAPDGTTSRAAVPSLSPLGEARAQVSWTVPTTQAIGDITVDFEVDPDELVVDDANRSNNADSMTLFVGRLPVATLGSVIPTLTFDEITLDASASNDPDGGDLYCMFEIEDIQGNDPILVSNNECQHTLYWEDDGDYDVTLHILDDEGDSHSITTSVTILNRPAIINLGASETSVKVGEPVTFNAYDRSDQDSLQPSGDEVDMLWLPPDDPSGSPYSCAEGMVTQECTVTPLNEGQFMMSFRGIDDDGAITQATHSIVVTNIAPYNGSMELREVGNDTALEPDVQQVWHVNEDQALELVGHVMDSPNDMDTLRWSWQPDVDNDPSLQMTSEGATSVVPVSWSDNGLHKIVMQVFDDDDESSGLVSRYARVHNVPPTIEPFEQQLPLWEDAVSSFTAEYSDTPSDVESLVACWDLDPFINADNDGTADDDCDVNGALLAHSWANAGTYGAIFHVTDDDGDRASQMINFTVRNRKPTAEIYASNLVPKDGEMFSLSGNLSSDTPSDLADLIYHWDLNTNDDTDDDGDPANDIDETGIEIWIKMGSGSHNVRLMVKDESETATADIVIDVQKDESGFFSFLSFEDGGVALIVIILALILVGLLAVLGWTSMQGRETEDPWDALSVGAPFEEVPSSAPSATMFAATIPEGQPPAEPTETPAPVEAVPVTGAPPIPAEGLPPGWTEEQWTHYGAQWLAQEAEKAVQPPPGFGISSEGDMDLDL
jgi:hypothetical protein